MFRVADHVIEVSLHCSTASRPNRPERSNRMPRTRAMTAGAADGSASRRDGVRAALSEPAAEDGAKQPPVFQRIHLTPLRPSVPDDVDHGGDQAAPALPVGSGAVASVAALLAWCVCSGGRMFANKALYSSGFRFPFAVTGACQAAALLSALALTASGACQYRPCASWRQYFAACLPASVASVATLYTGNVGVMILPVTFVQIVKGLTPSITLVLAASTGAEALTVPLVATVATISLGSAISCLQQSSLPGFSVKGFAVQVCSQAKIFFALQYMNAHTIAAHSQVVDLRAGSL